MAEKKASLIIVLKDMASAALNNLEAAVQKLRQNVLAAAAAFGSLSAFMVKSLSEFGEQEQAVTRLNTSLRNLSGESEATGRYLVKMAEELARTTKFSDTTTISMQALLATMGFNGVAIAQLTPVVQNMATAMGVDLSSAAMMLGKSIETGSTAIFKRHGIVLDETAFKSHNLSKVIEQLNGKFKDNAAIAAATTSGGLMVFRNAVSQINQELGGAISVVLGPFVRKMTEMAQGFKSLGPEVKTVAAVVVVAAVAFTGLLAGLAGVAAVLPVLSAGFAILASPMVLIVGGLTILGTATYAARDAFRESFRIMLEAVQHFGNAMTALRNLDFSGAVASAEAGGLALASAVMTPMAGIQEKIVGVLEGVKGKFAEFRDAVAAQAAGEGEAPGAAPGKLTSPEEQENREWSETDVERKILSIKGYQAEVEMMEIEHQARILEIQGRTDEARRLKDATTKKLLLDGAKMFFTNLATFQNSKNKEMAKVGQIGAIGQNIIYTYLSATEAYHAMASIPLIGPALGVAAAAAAVAAGMANLSQIKGVTFAEGGMVFPSAGGTLATIGEAGKAEAVVPLDDPETKEKLADVVGGGVTVQVGTLVADQMGLEEFARRLDETLWRLRRNRQTVAI